MSLVAATMPQLRELHLGSNNISSLSSGLKGGEGQSPAALQHLEVRRRPRKTLHNLPL